MRRLALLGLLLGLSAAAQAQHDASALEPYLGAWTVAIAGTPIGVITGTMTVAPDASGTLSLGEMQVESAALQDVHATDSGFEANSAFFSPVSGQFHEVMVTLAPQDDGTLAGTTVEGRTAYDMTARRPLADAP